MSQPQHSEIQIAIPFNTLVGAINQLPTEALLQLLHATEATLATRADARPEGQGLQGEDAQFWESELGQYVARGSRDVRHRDVGKIGNGLSGCGYQRFDRDVDGPGRRQNQ